MNQFDLSVEADISRAFTLSSDFYTQADIYEKSKEKIFARSWQCIGRKSEMPAAGTVRPLNFLENCMDEPLMLSRDQEGELRCLSNVCTHRGFVLVDEEKPCAEIRCRYHARRFGLDGKFKTMPQFKEAKNFPAESDDLPQLDLKYLGELVFTAIDPKVSFESWLKPMMDRVGFMPFDEFVYYPEYSQTYEVNAHWALYCDNFLEGFHIPFVHPGLNEIVSFPDYEYEIFEHGSLQVGVAKGEDRAFTLPEGHPDSGRQIAAYWFWFFPNIMFNVYPWGLSLNLINPKGLNKTEIRFETYLWKPELFKAENQDLLHLTEMEDEAVVESVQMGVKSRLYNKGRFSPKQEVAVHHFHRLVSEAMKS